MRKVDFTEKEAPLREDVRVLGALVGGLLAILIARVTAGPAKRP